MSDSRGISLVAIIAALALTSCSKDERRAIEAVRRHAKYAASVEIGNLNKGRKVRSGIVLCGAWTAATGYGSMDAWRGFMLLPNQKTALYIPSKWDQDPRQMRKLASTLCPGYRFP
jgi:hypothetical protein